MGRTWRERASCLRNGEVVGDEKYFYTLSGGKVVGHTWMDDPWYASFAEIRYILTTFEESPFGVYY